MAKFLTVWLIIILVTVVLLGGMDSGIKQYDATHEVPIEQGTERPVDFVGGIIIGAVFIGLPVLAVVKRIFDRL